MHRISTWIDNGLTSLKRRHNGENKKSTKSQHPNHRVVGAEWAQNNSWFARHAHEYAGDEVYKWQYNPGRSLTTKQHLLDEDIDDDLDEHRAAIDATSCLNEQETATMSSSSSSHSNTSNTNSMSRSKIRTNPWMNTSMTESQTRNRPSDLACCDSKHSEHVPTLDQSICSSGYGSVDVSPECSVHSADWLRVSTTQPIPEVPDITTCDKHFIDNVEHDDDDYDYCELDEELIITTETLPDSETSLQCSFTSQSSTIHRHQKPPPEFHAPPPPPIPPNMDPLLDHPVLTKLSQKVGDLRQQTLYLQTIMSQAKLQRDRHLRHKQCAMEQLNRLQHVRWRLEQKFEMNL